MAIVNSINNRTDSLIVNTSVDTATTGSIQFRAWDADDTTYRTFATLSADATTPTMDLDTSVTVDSAYIYRVGGTDVSVEDGGTGVSSLTAYSILCGGETSTGALQSVASVGTAAQVLTSNGAGALPTFQDASAGGMAKVNVTASTQAMAVETEYTTNHAAALCTYTLPATASVGAVIQVVGNSSNGWSIAQNASQVIHMLGSDTTTGITGSLSSTVRYDCVTLKCTVTDTDFVVISSMGNLTVV